MALLVPLLFLAIFSFSSTAQSQHSDSAFISAIISGKGLDFVKDILVEQELKALTPLRLPDINKSIRIPLVGAVEVSISNITLSSVDVSSSVIRPGDTGVVIVVSGATANLSLDWEYTYSTWLIPIGITDNGVAFIEVQGMEVGLTMTMKNQNGTLELNVTDCGCYVEDIFITLNGGASWFYQGYTTVVEVGQYVIGAAIAIGSFSKADPILTGFVYAFEDQIRAAVEKAITKKITEGTSKLNLLLQSLPKKIDVDHNVALDVTFVDDPMFGNSSIEFDIYGLFVPSDKAALSSYLNENSKLSDSCLGTSNMLGISLDEAVFNSASVVYFQEGMMHWLVAKVPDQSLLNTKKWKYIVPQLYRKYPNDDMQLNLTLTSPPIIRIKPQGIGGTITTDMTVNVFDAGETIPVACITVEMAVSGVVRISGNNLAGEAELHDFSLNLKWSEVGNFHMYLIQETMRVFLNTVFVPIINSHMRKGFPLPIVNGFTLRNAYILNSISKMVVCADVVFRDSSGTNAIRIVHL